MSTTKTQRAGSSGLSQLELCLPATSTGETSRKSVRTISKDTYQRISSPASGAGRSRCGASDGATIDLFGPRPYPVKDSPVPESVSALKIRDICGLSSPRSSRSAALQSSLESSLRTILRGSDLCEVTWKPWNTPWGQSLSKPVARARSTDGRDITLWPTPTTSRGGPNNNSKSVRLNGHGTNTVGAVKASFWGTPRASAGRSTASTKDRSRLEDQVLVTAFDGSQTGTAKCGALHPEFAAWLLMYPDAWLWTAPKAKR
ncbi:hypothetical protein Bra1253DRAFT_07858 [Bradyrhizobium sp. WSM1253]|nr:hypothetical protein Bra1253DRAFT_07858 [Bradyrhizobium sp. WSM1253]